MRTNKTKQEVKPPDDRRYKAFGYCNSLIDPDYLRSYPVVEKKNPDFVQRARKAGAI